MVLHWDGCLQVFGTDGFGLDHTSRDTVLQSAAPVVERAPLEWDENQVVPGTARTPAILEK